MRAGKVKTGESVIVNEIKKEIWSSLLLQMMSDNTAKLITDKCKSYKVPFRKFGNRNELGIALGKGERVNVGITDQALLKSCYQW